MKNFIRKYSKILIFATILIAGLCMNKLEVFAFGGVYQAIIDDTTPKPYRQTIEVTDQTTVFYNGRTYLRIRGFAYLRQAQNYGKAATNTTDATTGKNQGATHMFVLTVGGVQYPNTGNNKVNLSELESLAGKNYRGTNTTRVPSNMSDDFNYYYEDVGFEFDIPLDDLTTYVSKTNREYTYTQKRGDFLGITFTEYLFNTANGNTVSLNPKMYSSISFPTIRFNNNYEISGTADFNNAKGQVIVSKAFARTGAGKTSGRYKVGRDSVYFHLGDSFTNLSTSAKVGVITWYGVMGGVPSTVGGIYRFRPNCGNNYAWIPSTFLDVPDNTDSNTEFAIKVVYNAPPRCIIDSLSPAYQGNVSTESLGLVSKNFIDCMGKEITDSFGISSISDSRDSHGRPIAYGGTTADMIAKLNTLPVGTYSIDYIFADKNNTFNRSGSRTLNIDIIYKPNEFPTIAASRVVVLKSELNSHKVTLTDTILANATANDAEDGNISSKINYKVYTNTYGEQGSEALAVSNDLQSGTYYVVYSVADSKAAMVTKKVTLHIVGNIGVHCPSSLKYKQGSTITNEMIVQMVHVTDSDTHEEYLNCTKILYSNLNSKKVGTYRTYLSCEPLNDSRLIKNAMVDTTITPVYPTVTANNINVWEGDTSNKNVITKQKLIKLTRLSASSITSGDDKEEKTEDLTDSATILEIEYNRTKINGHNSIVQYGEGSGLITSNGSYGVNNPYVGIAKVIFRVTNSFGNSETIAVDVNILDGSSPRIIGANKMFYVGDEVTRDILLTRVAAGDHVDGIITDKLQVSKVEIVSSDDSENEVVFDASAEGVDFLEASRYPTVMSTEDTKTYKVTFFVTNSRGNTSTFTMMVKVYPTGSRTRYARFITKEFIDTTEPWSAWREPENHAILVRILDADPETPLIKVHLTHEMIEKIKAELTIVNTQTNELKWKNRNMQLDALVARWLKEEDCITYGRSKEEICRIFRFHKDATSGEYYESDPSKI